MKSALSYQLADDEIIFNKYNSSFRKKIGFSSNPPKVNTLIRDNLFNKALSVPGLYTKIPFEKKHNGDIVLSTRMKEHIEKGKKWAIEEAENFVEIIAAYEAKYVVMTGDDTFYQNHFVDEKFEQAYNESFVASLDVSLEKIAKQDAKKNRMNEKYLNSSLMRKPYQEHYVLEKSTIQNSHKNLRDNYEALTAIQGETNVSVEDFKKAFGNEDTVFLVEAERTETTGSFLRGVLS